MEVKANLNYLKIAPRKARLVANLIKGMDIKEAETQLKFIPKRASVPLLKLLNSAIANAKNNFNLEKDILYIKKLTVNEGPPFKRWRASSRGRSVPIRKRSSHINLVLDIKKGTKIEPPIAKVIEDKKAATLSSEAPSEERKLKYKAPKKITKKSESKGLFKKMFRRKSF